MGGEEIPAQYGLQGTFRTDLPEEDQHLPVQHWITAEILVRHWAYGAGARNEQLVQPDLRFTTFIARIIANGSDVLVVFRVTVDDALQEINVQPLARASYGSVLNW